MERVRYMISDAANMIQVESHVLRYWEEELELNVPRNEMGHRYYTEENIRQFEQIKRLKAEGFQLKAIKMLIHNPPAAEDRTVEIGGGQAVQNRFAGTGGQTERDRPAGPESRMTGSEEGFPEHADGENTEISAVGAKTATDAQDGQLSQLEQFQLMMNEIVCTAISRNNRALGQEIGTQVEEKVIKEMNYLMRDREEREEERFRRLDEAIRKRQRRSVKEKPQKRKIFHTPIHKAEEMG